MILRVFFITAFPIVTLFNSAAQEGLKYQLPPAEIVKIVDAPQTPGVSVSPERTNIILTERTGLTTIEELSAVELRMAGLRINPVNNGPGRQTFIMGYRIMNIDGTDIRQITGLPENPRLGSPAWSPDGKKFAFTNTKSSSIELWICDVPTLGVKKIADSLNMVFGSAFNWLSDNRSIIYYVSDQERGKKPGRSIIPEGPVVQENIGKQGQSRTFQDLLKDATDETIFEYHAKSQVMLWDGTKSVKLGEPAMITDISPSPDGQYFMVKTINRPFSYMVPYNNFPSKIQIWDIKGNIVKTLLTEPLVENIPRGYDVVLPGRRSFNWRADKPAMVLWVEALDEGDYEKKMKFHDQVYMLNAPFSDTPAKLIATEMRYGGIIWGKDDYAIISERLSKTRSVVVSSFNPSDPHKGKQKIQEYNSDDRYSNPGSFMTVPNSFGSTVLLFTDKGKTLFLTGSGASPEGDHPFIDKYDIASGKTTRLWRSEAPYYESVNAFIDISKNLLLTNRQSVTDVPNYFVRNLKNGKVIQVTKFENPYPQLTGITKELVKYKRNDGVDLTFTLYLPAGYNKEKEGPLPALLWAYPREFNDPAAAGQVSGSPYTFTTVSPGSALVYLTQGYAILMDAAFPIVKAEGKEPNDTYIEQLIANAEAAVNKAAEMGVTDRKRIAVSGHSYGAFMTANLIANTRLFAAGIAESGAYNRTLTPFGFQSERRTYWEAPAVYNRMSPFMYADKVKDPILLIHGTADNNDGTFPMQSERFFAALKGFGATVRLVLLPNESHGYAARETILHKHREVLNWMDKYVKNLSSGHAVGLNPVTVPKPSGLMLATFDIDVTPPVGYQMAYNPVVKTWDMGLRAKGMVLSGSGQPIVLVAFDWIGIANESQDEFKRALASAAGTIPERVAVHCLHQHDAPRGDIQNDFVIISLHRLEMAVHKAMQQLQPVTHIGLGSAKVDSIASNRRILGQDGKVRETRWTASPNPKVRAEPEGLIDPILSEVSFWNGDNPIAVLSFYASHPQSYYQTGIPNPDYPGIARFYRQLAVPDALHIHFTGAGGNVGAGKYNDGSHVMRGILAERLADGMKRAWESSKRIAVTASYVSWNFEPVVLVPDSLKSANARSSSFFQRYKAGKKIDIECLTLGNARILFMPGELCVEYQLAAKAMRPDLFIAMAAYGDGGPGYIPTAKAFKEGGYEPGASRITPEAEGVLMSAMKKLLNAKP